MTKSTRFYLLAALLLVVPRLQAQTYVFAGDSITDGGAWLKVNGEGVDGSRTWTVFGEGNAWRFTRKGDKTVYAVALGNDRPVIEALGAGTVKVRRVERLGGGKVPFKQSAAGLQISPDGAEAIAVYRITLR